MKLSCKKIGILCTVFCLLVLIVNVAVVNAADKDNPVTIDIGVWSNDEGARLKAAFEGIEDKLGIKINIMQYPSDSAFWNNIPGQIAAGTAPDIIACTNEHYLQYIEKGLFMPLNKYVKSGMIDTSGIMGTAMDAWIIDGNIYGIPYALNPGVFIINDTLWQEYDLGEYPKTWSEVLDVSKYVKEKYDMKALCFNIQEYHITNYVLSFGGGWDFGKTINTKENAAALQWIIDTYQKGYVITPTELGLGWDGAVMLQESALMSTGGAWYQSNFEQEAPDIKLKYIAVPSAVGSDGYSTNHSAALVALKNNVDEEKVAEVIAYALDDRLFEATISLTSVIPAHKDYYSMYQEEFPELADLVDILQKTRPFKYPGKSKQFADSLIQLMQQAIFTNNSGMTGQEIVNRLANLYGSN